MPFGFQRGLLDWSYLLALCEFQECVDWDVYMWGISMWEFETLLQKLKNNYKYMYHLPKSVFAEGSWCFGQLWIQRNILLSFLWICFYNSLLSTHDCQVTHSLSLFCTICCCFSAEKCGLKKCFYFIVRIRQLNTFICNHYPEVVVSSSIIQTFHSWNLCITVVHFCAYWIV